MWNNLLKITLVSYVWKRYRRTLIALPLLLLYFWFVNLIHHDIVAYSTLNNDTAWLGWSFLIKWLFIALGVVTFVCMHARANALKENQLNDSLVEKVNVSKKVRRQAELTSEVGDIFDRIRSKESLRSKADIVLEKKT